MRTARTVAVRFSLDVRTLERLSRQKWKMSSRYASAFVRRSALLQDRNATASTVFATGSNWKCLMNVIRSKSR